MASIVNTNLAGSTITYNGVQFGGADAAQKSVPPEYSLQGTFRYDDAGRAVIGVAYVMTVKTKFYEATEVALANNVDAIREKLSAPGRILKIEGIGLGFGRIVNDMKWGPKPLSFDWQPLGELCWECIWTVSFFVSECASDNATPRAWVAWNYETSWQNDFEGNCTRTMGGYVEIAGRRNAARPQQVLTVADQVRESIQVVVPANFKRVNNVWRESADKTRLDFVVVDQQQTGDPFPPGITQADGYCSFDSSSPGFAKSNVTIGMTLRTAPGTHPGIAGTIFVAAAIAKMNAIQRKLGSARGGNAFIVPKRLSIVNRKFDNSRTTEGTASFELTKCLADMLNAAGIWEPLTDGNYQQWRTSIEKLWGNRGTAGLGSLPTDDLIIDVCDSVNGRTWGEGSTSQAVSGNVDKFSFSCPDIPADGGWIGYELHVRLVRQDKQAVHKKALPYTQSPIPQSDENGNPATGSMLLGSPPYQQSSSEQHVVEYQGYPRNLVVMQFKGLRIKHKPFMPTINTVGGQQVVEKLSSVWQPRVAFDVFTCPAWFASGWRVYEVLGPVNSLKSQGSKTSCAASETTSTI